MRLSLHLILAATSALALALPGVGPTAGSSSGTVLLDQDEPTHVVTLDITGMT